MLDSIFNFGHPKCFPRIQLPSLDVRLEILGEDLESLCLSSWLILRW